MRLLFVSNGHGEIAIADRIAAELRGLGEAIEIDHLALVGDIPARHARDVGPRRRMPSGGLIAMFNLPNILRDLRAGLLGLTLEQWRWLRASHGRYDAVIATGDAYALWMALRARSRTVFVGTAKSVLTARYGFGERRVLRHADEVFVRDEATADDLRRHGVAAEAPGNVIVDLFAAPAEGPTLAPAIEGFDVVVALLPGSRAEAYDNASFLMDVVAAVARERPGIGAVLSLAPNVDAAHMVSALTPTYAVRPALMPGVPFDVLNGGRVLARAWCGDVGALLNGSTVVLGQAGTANEAAVAAGLPVLAVSRGTDREHGWYRHRQTQLLGDALVMISGDLDSAARELRDMLDDPQRRARLGELGRERMGPAGGARRIAERIVALAREAA